jgi:PTS system cellobiose-specific IIC component
MCPGGEQILYRADPDDPHALPVCGAGGVLANVLHTDLIHLITTFIQQPLRLINTSLPGTIFIYSFGNFLFTLGIHQSVVNSVVLEPFLLINTNENMLAFANGQPIPHIINNIFVPTFGMVGGTGSTISLLIAIFIFSRQKSAKQVARLSLAPGCSTSTSR